MLSRVALILLVFLVVAVGQGETVSVVTLGEPVVQVKPNAINGMNFGNWMVFYDLLPEYQELNIPLLRFPAGNYGDDYLLTERGLKLFAAIANSIGATPMVQHNLLKGDPQEAAKWVQFSLDEGLGIKHWFIGNEPDLYGPNRAQPQWTAEYYANTFRDYAAAIKAVDPDAKVIGPAVTNTPNELWLKTFLTIAGDVVDVLAWQWYPSDGSMDEKEALATAAQVRNHITSFREWTKDPAINPLGYQREIPLFISEFGLSWRTNHARLLTDMTAALWLAEVYGEMVLAEIDYTAYFALQGTGGHGLFDTALWPRPTYFVLWQLAQMGDTWHDVHGVGPREKLVAYGSRRDNQSLIWLINKEHEARKISLPQANDQITSYWIDHQDQEEIHTKTWQETVEIAPYSATLIVFEEENK